MRPHKAFRSLIRYLKIYKTFESFGQLLIGCLLQNWFPESSYEALKKTVIKLWVPQCPRRPVGPETKGPHRGAKSGPCLKQNKKMKISSFIFIHTETDEELPKRQMKPCKTLRGLVTPQKSSKCGTRLYIKSPCVFRKSDADIGNTTQRCRHRDFYCITRPHKALEGVVRACKAL